MGHSWKTMGLIEVVAKHSPTHPWHKAKVIMNPSKYRSLGVGRGGIFCLLLKSKRDLIGRNLVLWNSVILSITSYWGFFLKFRIKIPLVFCSFKFQNQNTFSFRVLKIFKKWTHFMKEEAMNQLLKVGSSIFGTSVKGPNQCWGGS